MAARDDTRRSYGTGSLIEKADSAGRVSWYGKWRADGPDRAEAGNRHTHGPYAPCGRG